MSYTDDLIAIGWVEAGNTTWPPPAGWAPNPCWTAQHLKQVRHLGPVDLPDLGTAAPSEPKKKVTTPVPHGEPTAMPGHGWERRLPRRSETLEPTWMVAGTSAPARRLDEAGNPYWERLSMNGALLFLMPGAPLLWGHDSAKVHGWVLDAELRDDDKLWARLAWPTAAEMPGQRHAEVRSGLLSGELALSLGWGVIRREQAEGRVIHVTSWVPSEVSATPTPAICGTGRAVRHG